MRLDPKARTPQLPIRLAERGNSDPANATPDTMQNHVSAHWASLYIYHIKSNQHGSTKIHAAGNGCLWANLSSDGDDGDVQPTKAHPFALPLPRQTPSKIAPLAQAYKNDEQSNDGTRRL